MKGFFAKGLFFLFSLLFFHGALLKKCRKLDMSYTGTPRREGNPPRTLGAEMLVLSLGSEGDDPRLVNKNKNITV